VAIRRFVNSRKIARDHDNVSSIIAGRFLPIMSDANPQPACPHKRTQVIAKDSDAQYMECLDCGEIFEAGEVGKKEPAGFDESLSDA
jgi:hypothetical protein